MQQKTWFRTLQRWRFGLSAVLDALFWYAALWIAVLARLDFTITNINVASLLQVATVAALVQLTTGIATGLYRGRRAIASFSEVRLVVLSTLLATVAAFVVVAVTGPPNLVPISTVFAAGAYQLLAALGIRYLGRLIIEIRTRSGHVREHRTLIFGAGDGGEQISNALLHNVHTDLDPVAFLDDDPTKRRLVLNGIRVVGTRADIAEMARRYDADTLLLAFPDASQEDTSAVADLGQAAGLTVKILPSVYTLTNGTVSVKDIRDIELSDFLNRDEVEIDDAEVLNLIAGKRVLVTGAGGSIGSVLCRTIADYKPARLIMLDHDENALHDLALSLNGQIPNLDDLVLCDIRDQAALHAVFESTHPDIVFHTAAHKHVPFLERFPSEGYKTNVVGTTNVLTAASDTATQRFINISTDKAADPINVLGETKRTAERITAHFDTTSTGRYLSVRFGNVLGSAGSVIPTFMKQLERGEPITVTDPEVTRYFMTTEEAVLLVLQAAALGEGGDVLVLDMGEPVSIDTLARRLSRQVAPGREPDIVYTGLRPGEKLHEVLTTEMDTPLEQPHPRLSRYAVPPLDPNDPSAITVGSPPVPSHSSAPSSRPSDRLTPPLQAVESKQ